MPMMVPEVLEGTRGRTEGPALSVLSSGVIPQAAGWLWGWLRRPHTQVGPFKVRPVQGGLRGLMGPQVKPHIPVWLYK